MENLVDVQNACGLKVATKLSKRHTDFKTQKMKCKLALQVISRSTAVGIDVCKSLGIPGFEDSAATTEFLETFNSYENKL